MSTNSTKKVKNFKSIAIHWQVLISILAAVLVGVLFHSKTQNTSQLSMGFISLLDFGSDVFLRLLSMIVIPLIIFSVFNGITQIRTARDLKQIGLKTAMLYVFTSLVAIVTGLIFVNLLQPGVGANLPLPTANANTMMTTPDHWWNLLTRIIPKNPFAALASGDMVSIIFYVIVFAIFTMRIDAIKRQPILELFEGFNTVFMKIVHTIIKLAPIGIFCIVTKLISTTGMEIFIPLLKYLLTAFIGLAFHFFIFLPFLYKFKTGKSPRVFLNAMSPALLTAFSTASSASTLPLTLECATERAKLSKKTSGIVLPLGATINMDGTALYEGVAVLFIAQALGVDLSLIQQVIVLFTALLVSIGAAGIPHAGLVMMVIILKAVNLPLEATGMIWAVDRILDMARTATNVWSDCVITAVVDNASSHD